VHTFGLLAPFWRLRAEALDMTFLRRFWLVAALPVGAAACSSDADHTPLPQLVDLGGQLLSAPNVVTVTFANDTLTSQVRDIGASLTSSAWWNVVRPGYCAGDGGSCVGDGPRGSSAILLGSPAATYTDSDQGQTSTLQQLLAGAFADGTLPKPEANNVFVVYFPVGDDPNAPTTTIALGGMVSCIEGGFDGYHNFMAVNGQQVAYSVVMECTAPPPMPPVPPIDLLQNTTITTSHEIFESATDPIPPTGFALDLNDLNNWGWADIVGVEGADLCVDPFGLEQDETRDGTYTVQRIWSNSRAAAGVDPCVPAPEGEAYFNASPKTSSFYILDVGASTTFEVDAWSNGPIGDWTLIAQDWSPTPTYLSFSIAGGQETAGGPQIQAHNGSRVEVTVTLNADPGSLPNGEADGSIISFSGDAAYPTAAHYWPFVVMSPADAADAGIPPTARTSTPARVRSSPRIHRYGSPRRRSLTGALSF
jgi:hypothetical protein